MVKVMNQKPLIHFTLAAEGKGGGEGQMTAERVVREHVYYDNDTAEGGQMCSIVNIHGARQQSVVRKRVYTKVKTTGKERREIFYNE